MSDDATSQGEAPQEPTSLSTSPDEPFVYPTIGTERIIEKSDKPAGHETRESGDGRFRG